MKNYSQFILWTLRNDIKLPISPKTGAVIDAHDSSHWVSYEDAKDAVWERGASGVAFVFTENDPFWFLDIDKCLQDDNTWSPLAQSLCAMFPGALMEVSQSGRGLHIFGSGTVPPHGCKNKKFGIEFYTSGRFVALTGTGETGNADTDHTAAVAALVQQYFPLGESGGEDAGDENWQDMPSPDWNGPTDDMELLKRILASRATVGQLLGGKASPAQLWSADAQALAACFPPNRADALYDASSADAALAAHLAFWTGRNTERMRRMMNMSGLVRDKWERHRRYLWMTISNACRRCKDVYKQPTAVAVAPIVHQPTLTSGSQYMTAQQQIEYFRGCVYVRDVHRVFTPDGALLKSEQFRAVYGGYLFNLDAENSKTTRNAWEVLTESQAIRFPKVEAVCFRPEINPGGIVTEEGRRLINTYVPILTGRKQGDASPFLNHVKKMLPNERDYQILIAYMAAMVQHPGTKFQWCPVIQGVEGNGKTMLISAMAHCVGHRYTHLPNSRELGESGAKFNEWIQGNLFIGVEEITVNNVDILEALKPLVTNSRLEVQGKGKGQVTGDNRANFMMCYNPKGGIPIKPDSRRYAVFHTAQQSVEDCERDGMMGRYFPDLWAWLRADGFSIINEYLHTYAIPDELNPATMLMRAPVTSSTKEAIEISYDSVQQEITEAIAEGRNGFANGWVNSLCLDQLIKDLGAGRKYPPRHRRELMKSLGYEWHPGLKDGRLTVVLPGQAVRAKLYVKTDLHDTRLTVTSEIVTAYNKAQAHNNPLMVVPNAPINSQMPHLQA